MIGKFLKEKRIEKNVSFDSICLRLSVKDDYVRFLEDNQIFAFSENRINSIIDAYLLNEHEAKEFRELLNS